MANYHASTRRSTNPANGLMTLTKRDSGSKAEVGFCGGRSFNLRGRRMNWRRILEFVNDMLTIFYQQFITNHKVGKPTPDQRIYPSYATCFLHLPKAHLHPSLPPKPNDLLTSSRLYSDPHLASDSRTSCLFCIERVPVRSTFSAIVPHAFRGDVGAHLRGSAQCTPL